MTDREKLTIAVNKATALIFLNQGWLTHLRDVLQENELLTETIAELIRHGKAENRNAFNELIKLEKE